jgi:hypothetical protein
LRVYYTMGQKRQPASKGTLIYPVRLDPFLVAQVEETIARRNLWSPEEPWTFSDFVRICLRREMRKMHRSRAPRRKK